MSADQPSEAPAAASQPPPGDPEPSVPEMPEPPDLPPVPDDAGDTRTWHFRRLLGNGLVIALTAIFTVATLAIVSAQAGIALGAAGAALILVLALLVIFALASSKAADDFFRAYAEGRGLTRIDGKSNLPPVTPLLRKGDRRYAAQRFNGVLPGGLDGSLCLYTYEEETRDSDGDKQTTYVHYTLAMTQLPDTAPFIQELFLQRRFGFRFLDSMEDAFRKRQRVEQESDAVDRQFEIFIGANDDMSRARQILSPSFLVWLESHSSEQFAFELVAGSLVANVKGHKKSSAELDLLCEATAAVARRLHEEATELSSSGASEPPPA